MESHINTFEKGMTKDTNILYQPDGTYRNCINCQLISVDGNNYTIKDCLGNVKVFNINIPFNTFSAGPPLAVTYQNAPMPIGFISFPNALVVFSTNNEGEGTSLSPAGYGEIGVIRYQPYGEGIQPITNPLGTNTYKGYVPLYHHISLKFTKQRQIEGFAFEENDLMRRVYWTDDLNEPRVFDIGNPIFENYIVSGSLVATTQYMVVEGIIEHPVGSGFYYGPGLATPATVNALTGNTFTATATTYTDQSSSFVTAKVIVYYPYQLLSFTPSRSLGNIRFDSYGTGSLYAGAKMYFYRLTNSADGINTSWSYGSTPIHVGTTNSIPAIPANAYEDFVGAGSQTLLQATGNSVKINIDNIDTNFANIQVACAEYDQLLNVPRQITIIADSLISAVTMATPPTGSVGVTVQIEHTGNSNLGTLTTDDITLFPASILSCKTMSTNKNYILIGNITERTELEFDKTGITIGQIEYLMPVHEDNEECSNVFLYDQVGPTVGANPALVDGILPGTHWLVSVGIATYNRIAYGPASVGGIVFIGVAGQFNWVNTSATAVVRPCVSKNKYTTNAATLRPDPIEIKKGFWDYKDPAVAHHIKGYWNEETYRFGILFYDLKGNPFYVRWIGDYLTAKQETKKLIQSIAYRAAAPTDMAYLSQTGISISGITISASDIDKISGFSIVRAERDKRIITQGLLLPCGSTNPPNTFPANIIPVGNPNKGFVNLFNGGDGATYGYNSYICPDSLVNYPLDNLVIGNYIEECGWLDPKIHLGNPAILMKSSISIYQAETKYFNSVFDPFNPNRKNKVTAIAVVDEGAVVTDFGTVGATFMNNFIQTVGGPIADATCAGGGFGTIQNSIGLGGRKVILRTEGYIFDYSATASYEDVLLGADQRMLVNYVRDNPTPYGGTSEASLATTNYIQCGHFQPINATVKSETLSGTDYVFNNVEVWGGDAYTCLVDEGNVLYAQTLIGYPGSVQGYSWGIKFPCQSNVNYDLRRGRKISNNMMHSMPEGVAYLNAFGNTKLEGYSYNQAYSSDGMNFAYPALPTNYISSGIFRYRIRFAGEKFPGELKNSFRDFATLDYKDTDGQGGEINNLRTKDGRSIVWQNKIISTVPILERQLLGGASGGETTIGTGGVVDRFDPLNSYFGNQHQHGLTETEFGFVWFDMRRKAVVALDMSSGIAEISKVEGLNNFFNEIIVDNIGSTIQPTPLNSTTFSETSDRPLMGVGITGVYDPKLKMTYLTFKWKVYSSLSDFPKYISKNFTIGYYHIGRQFIGFYDWFPAISWNHNQSVLSVNDPKCKTKFYGAGMTGTAFVVGETVKVGSVEYVCITNVTVASYPGTAGASGTNPTTGTNNWTLLNQTNEIYVHNQPAALNQATAPDYQYNKFFGLVVNNEIEIVVNPKTPNPFSVLNIEQKGNNINYTDIYTEAESITAADNSITTTNRFYKWIYDKIVSNLPLSTTGRITNSYLKIRMVKKNWTTNPTTLTGLPKVFQYLKSYFEQKR